MRSYPSGVTPIEPEPDDKDWTWVVERRCPDCGFAAGEVAATRIPSTIEELTAPWLEVLAKRTSGVRPAPAVWSPLEYGCHVRDVCRLFTIRLRRMLSETGPRFDEWDQNAAAVAANYAGQNAGAVTREIVMAAGRLAGLYTTVADDAWTRTGTRSDGGAFTVLTLGQYGLHDMAHHLVDVGVSLADLDLPPGAG